MADNFVDDVNFLGESKAPEDFLLVCETAEDLEVGLMDLEDLGDSFISHDPTTSEAQCAPSLIAAPIIAHVHRSDRSKKPSTRLNGDLGFIPLPARSTMKKNIRRP